jgi:hypothetical protein
MHFPAAHALTRGFAAVLVVAAALPQVWPAHGQEAGQPHQHLQAVPFIELGQVADKGALRLLPPTSVTRHQIATDSGTISYTANAGTLALYDQSGERVAAVFYVSYVADKPAGIKRPVTFVFNGGPGAAAAYLHLGLVGPRLAEFRAGREDPPRLTDNPQTWLQFTDLVMIDPVGSGFSRPVRTDGANAFWAWRAMPNPSPRWSRGGWPTIIVPTRRNSSWARAMAASAPPRSRASCAASTASPSPAS